MIRNFELIYSTPRLPTGTEAVQSATQSATDSIFTEADDKIWFTEGVSRANRVMRLI